MDKIYYDGNLKASLTVGSVNGISEKQLEEALSTKADINHTHDEYLTQHQDISGLTSTVSDNTQRINNHDTLISANTNSINALISQVPDLDTEYDSLITNDKTIIGAINEIFQMIENHLPSYTITVNYVDIDGNVLQEPSVITLKEGKAYDLINEEIEGYTYSHADGDTKGIIKNNIVINFIYEKDIILGEDGLPLPTSEFYVQYTIENETNPIEPLNREVEVADGTAYPYLPLGIIADKNNTQILLKNGLIVNDLNVVVKDIERIRIYYEPDTTLIKFTCGSTRDHHIRTLEYINMTNISYVENMFSGCSSLTSLDLSGWNTSNVTDMSYMFNGCSSLEYLDLSNFDTSNVNNATNMLKGVPLDVDFNYTGENYENWTLSEYETGYSNIFPWSKEPESLFYTAYTINPDSSSPALYSEDIKDETIFAYGSYMPKFDNGYTYVKLLLNNGDTTTNLGVPVSEVQQATVWYSKGTTDISFANTKVKDVSYINLENIESLSFTDCVYLESVDLSKTTTKGKCVHEQTFANVPEECKITISKDWETKEEQSGFTGTFINPWKYYIEYRLSDSYNDIGDGYDTLPTISSDNDKYTRDYKLVEVFLKNGDILTESYSEILMKEIDHIRVYYHESTTSIKCNIGVTEILYINIENFTSMESMFASAHYLTHIEGISEWDISKIENISGIFEYCKSLKIIDLSGWDTGRIEYMNDLFHNCESLYEIKGIERWQTNNVLQMVRTFSGCSALTELNLSGWYTKHVENMNNMFDGCKALELLDLSGWNTKNVVYCDSALVGIPENVNWNYDLVENPESYANFTLTEEDTGFSGTFPWNVVEEPDSPYYLEYTLRKVDPGEIEDSPLGAIVDEDYRISYINLPVIAYDGEPNINYEYIKVIDREGNEIHGWNSVKNMNISAIESVVIYYPHNTTSIRFYASSDYCHNIKTLDYIYMDNIDNVDRMFYYCPVLEGINIDWGRCHIRYASEMFYDCGNLLKLDMSDFDTTEIRECDSMFIGLSPEVDWCYVPDDINSYANFTLSESITGFSGTFPWNVVKEPDSKRFVEYAIFDNYYRPLSETYEARFSERIDDEYWRDYRYEFPYYFPAIKIKGEEEIVTNYEAIVFNIGDRNSGEIYDTIVVKSIDDAYNRDISIDEIVSIKVYYPAEGDIEWIRFTGNGDEYRSHRVEAILSIYSDDLEDLSYMFAGCPYLKLVNMPYCSESLYNTSEMFGGCSSLTSLDLSGWYIKHVEDMGYMFSGCSSLEYLDLSGWDTKNVKEYSDMFSGIPENVNWNYDLDSNPESYANFTLSARKTGFRGTFPWNPDEGEDYSDIAAIIVYDTYSDFRPEIRCENFIFEEHYRYEEEDIIQDDEFTAPRYCIRTYFKDGNESPRDYIEFVNKECLVEVRYLDTSEIRTMHGMFENCPALRRVDCSNWVIVPTTDYSNMFSGCISLEFLDLSTWELEGCMEYCSDMFRDIPEYVDWNYDPDNPDSYAHFDVSESITGFSGTFPWNQ